MGKLFRHIALFALPILGLLVWLLVDTPEPAYRYRMVQKDCRTGNWIYRRLYESTEPVDIAFLGTSKTMCAVDDSMLEGRVAAVTGKLQHIVNMGICRIGENSHYLVARDLFAHKRPKHLILEVDVKLANNSHFDFPDLATAREILEAPIWLNFDYGEDLGNLTWNRLVYQREQMLGIQRNFDDFLVHPAHSYMRVQNETIADATEMAQSKERRQKTSTSELPSGLSGWRNALEARHPKYYLQALSDLCKENGCQLSFLYLPSYGETAPHPQEIAFLESLGAIWHAPDSVLGNAQLYADPNHLNGFGASRLVDWLAVQVAGLGQAPQPAAPAQN